MQSKTTVKYPFTLDRMAIIKKSTNAKSHSYAVSGSVNWCSQYGEEYGGSLKSCKYACKSMADSCQCMTKPTTIM